MELVMELPETPLWAYVIFIECFLAGLVGQIILFLYLVMEANKHLRWIP